ncbi:MAG: glycyl-radical enzyme activating protein [Candidatus Lokiarchaeota archaeon]|nr:glycyl-radical enzyme activating protein [Candidatus Lokiarchaeota archaeon]
MASPEALIFQIQKFSTEDGPGIRTTVFFKKCPLKCIWCHNPESILKTPQLEWFKHKCIGCKTCIASCQQNALSFDNNSLLIDREKCNLCRVCVEECPSTALNMLGEWWKLEDLFNEIEKDKIYYTTSQGGITVSGGEPTQQPEFITDFLRKCKENGINTAIDTCGYSSKRIYEQILPYVDLVLLDIKHIDSDKHKEYIGVPNKAILENANWIYKNLKKNGKKMWIRTPIIPNYTAIDENIRGIGEFIVNKLENFPERWDLLSFNNLCISKYERLDMEWSLKDEQLMKKEDMEHFFKIAEATGVKNPHWSGLTKRTEHNNKNTGISENSTKQSC